MHKFKILFFIIVFAAAYGCSVPEMFTYSPDGEKNDIEEGTEIAFIEDEYIFSNIEFEKQAEDNFVFYVFVLNKENESLEVDPSQIRMIAFDENKIPLAEINTFYAIEPGIMIDNLNAGIKNRETEHDVSTGFNIITAIISTAVDLSSNNSNKAGEVIENAAVFADNQIHEEIEFSNDVKYMESQKAFWKNEVLAEKELSANEDIGGLVYIPACPEAAYIKIIIPFEESKHVYFFKKEKIAL